MAQEGPDHDRRFEVALTLRGHEYGRAIGRSKKEAEQSAAAQALAALDAPLRANGTTDDRDQRWIPDDVLAVCRKLRAAGHEAHLVGGGVRDMLLGRTAADFDVATDARPEVVIDLFGTATRSRPGSNTARSPS